MIKFPKGFESEYLTSILKHPPAQKRATHGYLRTGGWLVWGAGLIGVLVLGFDSLIETMGDGLSVLFELVQQGLETMYLKGLGFEVHHAQMATAYSLFVISLAIAALIARRLCSPFKRAWLKWTGGLDKLRRFLGEVWLNMKSCWQGLDRLNRYAAMVGLILVIIPVLAMLSYGLGGVIAELL